MRRRGRRSGREKTADGLIAAGAVVTAWAVLVAVIPSDAGTGSALVGACGVVALVGGLILRNMPG